MTIRITIKDRDALQSITVKQLQTYLEHNGWAKKEDISRSLASGERTILGEVWSQDVGPTARTALVVPVKETLADYAIRLSEAMMELERVEGRSQLDIFVDITQTSIYIKPKKYKKN